MRQCGVSLWPRLQRHQDIDGGTAPSSKKNDRDAANVSLDVGVKMVLSSKCATTNSKEHYCRYVGLDLRATNRLTGLWIALLILSLQVELVVTETTQATTMSASFKHGWDWYKTMLVKKPLLTKATTSAVIMAMSDVACQKIETRMASHIVESRGPEANLQQGCLRYVNCPPEEANPKELFEHDWKRTADVAITGFTYSGPISHTWYAILEAVVRIEHRLLGILVRLMLDIVIFSPVAVGGYFTWRALLNGEGLDGVALNLKVKWEKALYASWQFWPIANIVNFSFVPVQFRVLYNNMLSLLWSGYLSHVNSKKLEQMVDNRAASTDKLRGGCQAAMNTKDIQCNCKQCRAIRA